MTKTCLCLLLHIIWAVTTQAQHKSHSLQSAVDALHRREAQLTLRDYESVHPSPIESGYYNEIPVELEHLKQQELNKLLANYLGSEDDDREQQSPYESDFDDEDYNGFDERKRSIFRERGIPDSPYQSVFRERESDNHQPDLAAQFLKEIDRERNIEREEAYKENLRRLWEKYQQQENEIEDELFDDDKTQSNIAPQSYWGPVPEKRRLVLPWLPAIRRKRFPVAKRSSTYPKQEAQISGTNEKVARDLEAIFGESDPIDEKKKRSSGDSVSNPVSTTTTVKPHKIDKKSDRSRDDEHLARQDQSQHYDDYQRDKPEDVHSSDDNDEYHEGDHDHEHEHEHDHEEDEEEDDFEDDDDDDKKKKRSTSDVKKKHANLEVLKEDQIIPGDLTDFKAKKSIQWNKYFGLDRKKKSDDWFMNKYGNTHQRDEYPIKNFRHHDEMTQLKPSSSLNEEKLQNMNQKLKSIEDLIIDETVKYTGSHEGASNPEEIQKLKDHVISRLATAYNLEKMRRALNKLKQSVDNERHLGQNEIEEEKRKTDADKEKRVAIKKEKVQFDNNHHSIEPPHEKVVQDVQNSAQDIPEEDKKKKKKNVIAAKPYPGYNNIAEFEEELGAGHFEPNDGYPNGRTSTLTPNQCPLILSMEKRCRGVDFISGDIQHELLPVCGIHQICYLCGTSQSSCDFQYLNDADSICGHNKDCQSAARSALMILRGTPGPLLGPRECAKNPCLHQVLRDIGLLI